MEKEEKSLYKQTVEECKILYCDADKSMKETCMCWGWECGKGWHDILQKLSYRLEFLNELYYPKYRVRVQADQVKEKFGTLRFYYTICVDSGKIKTFASRLLYKIANKFFSKMDFKIQRKIDAPSIPKIENKEISKEEYDKHKGTTKPEDAREYYEEDGKYYCIFKTMTAEKFHYEPTKHKFFYHLNNWLKSKSYSLKYAKDRSNIQILSAHVLDSAAEFLVRHAEQECYDHCEDCGTQLNEYNPRCMTQGWISYLCEKCAKKTKSKYIIDKEHLKKAAESEEQA